MLRVDLLRGTSSNISPIHWQYGGIARLSKDETIDSLISFLLAPLKLFII